MLYQIISKQFVERRLNKYFFLDPGEVESVTISNNQDHNECYHMNVEWTPLNDKDWHGTPDGYIVTLVSL